MDRDAKDMFDLLDDIEKGARHPDLSGKLADRPREKHLKACMTDRKGSRAFLGYEERNSDR